MKPVLAMTLAALAFGGIADRAHAGEGERALSLTAGFASVSHGDERIYGGALGVDYEYGVSPAVSVQAIASGGLYDGDGPAYSGEASIGLSYALDVIKYVPYVNAGIGGIVIAGDGIDTSIHPLVAIGGGVDLLHSRDLSYGVAVRYESLLQETDYLTAIARVTWRWGFF